MLTAAKGEVFKTIWRRMGSCVVQLCRVSRLRRRDRGGEAYSESYVPVLLLGFGW